MDLETIKSQLEWAKEKLSYAHALDNLEVEQVDWLIEQAEKIKQLTTERNYLKELVSQLRCEECGDELGENWVDDDGVVCGVCYENRCEDYY